MSGGRPGTLGELLRETAERLERAGLAFGHGTTNALDEAAWLVLHAAGLPLGDAAPHAGRELTPGQWKAARELADARIRTRKPAAYLLREAWLGPHRFYVDERVIVPRSFIFELLRDWKAVQPARVLDLCTGSGCLAIVAALRFPAARVDAADLSAEALEVARINVEAYGLAGRIALVRSDLFAALAGRTYDLIVSNPPYVKAAAMRRLPDEYRKEPAMALASGADGLDHTRAILAQAHRHLAPGGVLMVEIGHNRKALEKALPGLPFRWPRTSGGAGFVFTLQQSQLPRGA